MHASVGGAYLLVVLYAHADGVDENRDHDASVEVFALHDLPQLHPRVVPNVRAWLPAAAPLLPPALLTLLALVFATRTAPLLICLLHSSVFCFVLLGANRTHPVGERQGRGTLGAAVAARGGGEGHGW